MTRCEYQPAWVEQCRNDAVSSKKVCAKHIKKRCWCGNQAKRECSVAASFVCGQPLCDEHECQNVAAGLTGSSGYKHSKLGYLQWIEFKGLPHE